LQKVHAKAEAGFRKIILNFSDRNQYRLRLRGVSVARKYPPVTTQTILTLFIRIFAFNNP
jgi:hypothetical protein